MLKLAVVVGAVLFAASAAQAHHHEIQIAQAHDDHSQHGSARPAAAAQSPSTKAYEAANAKMHKDMAIKYSGNADIDLVRGMIPHHQGAIDMANVVLAHGKDPEIRKLAETIISAQKKEIAWMEEWLRKNAK